jgi:HEAT repeat protein
MLLFCLVSDSGIAGAQMKFPPGKSMPKMGGKKAPLPQALDARLKLLQDPKTPQAQRTRIIDSLKGDGSDKVVDALLAATRDGELVIRERAAQALGFTQNRQVEPRLLELYMDAKEPPSLRGAAVRSFGLVSGVSSAERLKQAMADPEPEIRKGAIEALLTRPFKKITNRTDLWLALLTDEGQEALTRVEAAESLGRRGDPAAVPALLTILRKPTTSVVRTPDAAPILEKADGPALEHSPAVNPDKQPEPAAPVAGPEKTPHPLQALFTGKMETQVNVRAKAARALGLIGDQKAVPELVAAVAKDQDPYVRFMAAQALSKLGGPEALKALLAAAGDGDVRVRRQVIFGLGKFKGPEVTKVLEPLLTDTDPGVRLHAAIGLAKDGNPAPLTAQAEKDEHKAVRGGARAALKQLGLPVPPEKPGEAKTDAPKAQEK